MSDDLALHRDDAPRPGAVSMLSTQVRRLVAPNAGPFTFTGTCTYLVGRGRVTVIDPGPNIAGHVEAILAATKGETIANILVTHTHRDHSPAAALLRQATGAPVGGCTPFVARTGAEAGAPGLDAAHDRAYAPDFTLADGESLQEDGYALRALATPGHASNHVAFALDAEQTLFSGDHVMGWSTTIVAPPDGSMGDYMASLEKLRGEPATIYWPGHGGPVVEPQRFLRGLIHHRRAREASILTRLRAGDQTIAAIVAKIYEGLNPQLTGAAALSVFAHLEHLAARGIVTADGPLAIDSSYRLADVQPET